MNVLASLTVLGILIFFHETGHFLAAVLQGIRVSGFSIGFGPSLIKKQFRGVTFSFRALPLGGFVSFPDDEEKNNFAKDDPNLLSNRPIPQRLLVISSGVIANLLVAWFVLFGQGAFIGIPSQPQPGVLIMGIDQKGAAANAGIVVGDQVLSIDGIELGSGQEAVLKMVSQIQNFPGKSMRLERVNQGKKSFLDIIPVEYSGKGKVGAQLQPNIQEVYKPAKSFNQVFRQANSQFSDLLVKTINGYKGLFTDFANTSKQMSGPVKIVEIGAQLSEKGPSGLLLFAALISINLAVLNSLPFPLLDGGQFALTVIEAIRGQPIPEKIQLAFM